MITDRVEQVSTETNTSVKANAQPKVDWVLAGCVILSVVLALAIIIMVIFFRMARK
jgi:hypothetical protein